MSSIRRSLKTLALLSTTTISLTVAGTSQKAKAVEPLGLTGSPQTMGAMISPVQRTNHLKITNPSNRFCTPARNLEAELDNIIKAAGVRRGKWGILIQSINGTTIYSHNPDSFLIPASNIKLLTTAAALHKYNPLSTSIRSKSLKDWVAVTNLRSNNFYADTLLRHIGGSHSVQKTLTQLGVDPLSYHMADGSGLSQKNLVTPRALVKVLQGMNYSSHRNAFLSSLPVAGVSGTLKHRLRQRNLEGFIHAKTGTLKGVRSLSGYMEHPDYGTLAFSIIANNRTQSGTALVKAIDDMVIHLFQSSSPYCHN
jgi:serine-type D-Ala-D-Ala carboxypeptidase/endopeptidase (penicillin-binding protein 4)